MSYAIFRRRTVKTGNLEGRDPVFTYARDNNYGEFENCADARRALMVALDPDLKGADDDHIKAHYNAWTRNVKAHKIQRI